MGEEQLLQLAQEFLFSDADLSKFGATKVANDWVI